MTLSTGYWLGVATGVISGACLMGAVVFGLMAYEMRGLRQCHAELRTVSR